MSTSDECVKPVLPKQGNLIIEDVQELVMCKPRLIPLRSFTLEKLEKMQKEAERSRKEQQEQPQE